MSWGPDIVLWCEVAVVCVLVMCREFEQGLTPLMEAAWEGHEIIVETLLACVSVGGTAPVCMQVCLC